MHVYHICTIHVDNHISIVCILYTAKHFSSCYYSKRLKSKKFKAVQYMRSALYSGSNRLLHECFLKNVFIFPQTFNTTWHVQCVCFWGPSFLKSSYCHLSVCCAFRSTPAGNIFGEGQLIQQRSTFTTYKLKLSFF